MVGGKITQTKCSEHSYSWKWPTLAGLPRGILLDPSLLTFVGATRSIIAYKKESIASDMVHNISRAGLTEPEGLHVYNELV
jgi:hypothetical protein